MYKLIKDSLSNKSCGAIKTNNDNSLTSFLFDNNNPNYIEYLAWLAQGNTPQEAE
jgi:hypothetical protein